MTYEPRAVEVVRLRRPSLHPYVGHTHAAAATLPHVTPARRVRLMLTSEALRCFNGHRLTGEDGQQLRAVTLVDGAIPCRHKAPGSDVSDCPSMQFILGGGLTSLNGTQMLLQCEVTPLEMRTLKTLKTWQEQSEFLGFRSTAGVSARSVQ